MTTTNPNKTANWLLPMFSGFLIGTSYIPFPPWASLFCFVPLWIFWSRQEKLSRVLLGGLLCAFIFTIIGFNWVAYMLHEFAHLPWFLSVIGMLLFALIAHLFVPVAGGLWFLIQRRLAYSTKLSICLMAIMTMLCEFYSLTLFDWNFGYSWYAAGLPFYQWAEFIGFSGLSVATLLCNLLLIFACQQRKLASGRILLAGVICGFLVLNAGGVWLENRLARPDASFKALLVQANIGNEQKIAAELGRGFRAGIFQRYANMTDAGIKAHADKQIDFILWPETAFPGFLGEKFKNEKLQSKLGDFIKRQQIPLITGSYGIDQQSRLITNSLFVVNKQGASTEPHYSKTILLAFGEYIPGERLFPQIRDWLPPIGHFARGPGATLLLKLDDFKMGPQICYESLFPEFSRDLADLGAQFIVNVTNDSWYGKWQEPYQHMYMTLARAVEFRRPLLRATNTGISTVVLASGKILEQSPLHVSWSGLYQVPYLRNPPTTFYQRWFYLVPTLLWVSFALLLMMAAINRKHHKT